MLQKLVLHVNEDGVNVVVDACVTRAPELVMHPYECHVLRRIVNKGTKIEAMDEIKMTTINTATELVVSQFGNYLL